MFKFHLSKNQKITLRLYHVDSRTVIQVTRKYKTTREQISKILAITVKIRPFLGILGDKTSNQNKEPGNCTVNRTGHRLQGAFRRLREFSGKLRNS